MAMSSAGGPTVRVTGFNFGISIFLIQSVLAGQVSSPWWSQSGPYHHRSVSRSSLDLHLERPDQQDYSLLERTSSDWVGSC